MFTPLTSHSVLFLDRGVLRQWSIGATGMLRALTTEETRALAWRLVDARTPKLLEGALQAEQIWISGCEPTGTPVGIVGGTMRLPDHSEYSTNGWLDPDGRFYPCGRGEHEALADALVPRGSLGAEERGWARIVDGDALTVRHTTIGQAGWLRRPGAVALTMGQVA